MVVSTEKATREFTCTGWTSREKRRMRTRVTDVRLKNIDTERKKIERGAMLTNVEWLKRSGYTNGISRKRNETTTRGKTYYRSFQETNFTLVLNTGDDAVHTDFS